MANPITWQNVNQDATAAYVAGNLMKNAEASFTGGAGAITGAYDQFQKDRSQANTAAYEAELAKYTTPEALKAAQDSGVLASLGKQFGLQMDQNVLKNGATEAMARNDAVAVRALETPEQAKALKMINDARTTLNTNRASDDTHATSGAALAGTLATNAQNAIVRAEYNNDLNRGNRTDASKVVQGTQTATLGTQAQTATDLVDIQGVDAKYRSFAADLIDKRTRGLITPTQETEAMAGFQASLAKDHGPAAISAVHTKYLPIMNGPARLDPAAAERADNLAQLAAAQQVAIDNNTYAKEASNKPAAQAAVISSLDTLFPLKKDASGRALEGEALSVSARSTISGIAGTDVEVTDPKTKQKVNVKVTNAMINQALNTKGVDNKYLFMDGLTFRKDRFLDEITRLASTPSALAEYQEFVKITEGKIRTRK